MGGNKSTKCPANLWKRGFSLVEVTLAVGVVSFALMSVIALIPTGLSSFKVAMDNSVGSQIVERIVNELQQTDFNTLCPTKSLPMVRSPYQKRYFDDQGNEVTVSGGTSAKPSGSIYEAQILLTNPTSLPGDGGSSNNLATVSIILVNNPTTQSAFNADGTFNSSVTFSKKYYTAVVSRNTF